jgi:capsular polysaccharide biosynthesis protein
VPVKPQSRGLLILVFGGLLAVLVSVILALIADRWDPSFRTPHEIEAFLGTPVLAALPKGVE